MKKLFSRLSFLKRGAIPALFGLGAGAKAGQADAAPPTNLETRVGLIEQELSEVASLDKDVTRLDNIQEIFRR